MKFKVDENLPAAVALVLREAGFDAETVKEELLSGATDQAIAERIQEESRVLVTLDLDFANIYGYPPCEYAGIVVLRPKMQDVSTVLEHARRFMSVLRHRQPAGELWIVQKDRIRFRQSI